MRVRSVLGLLIGLLAASSIVWRLDVVSAREDPQSQSRQQGPQLPANIAIDPELAGVVTDMLRTSDTFRRQCQMIGSVKQLRVTVTLNDPASDGTVLARCDMSRYEFGGMQATVRIGLRDRAIELIAHELEHVAEFAEHLNYRLVALQQPGAVWTSGSGRFESARAMEVGLRVEREVARANESVSQRSRIK